MKIRILLFFMAAFIISGCAEMMQIAKTMDTQRPLTQTEVVNGLKEALKIGSNKASSKLSLTDGYYRDEMVKILLPPEAATITQNLHRIPGGEKLLEDVLLRINRAAEDAAKEAAPIFGNAITKMTIQDGFNILKGKDDEATQFLKKNTYNQLVQLYSPKIKSSLDKKLVAGISTNESWNTLTSQWNNVAGSAVGRIAGFNKVNVKLDEYLTQNALNGLFLKLSLEEAEIRNNPAARVTEILRRVFGSNN
ncbi:MAG TPA: DUF4197 domain-containing protein [Marinilabiliaceae bacterium]|nr:DUF4197 domain-containing protein [Marinilabiliaceae bacterium]